MKKIMKRTVKKAATFTVACALVAGGIIPAGVISQAGASGPVRNHDRIASDSNATPGEESEIDPGFMVPWEEESEDETLPLGVLENTATPSDAIALRSNATGDLWTDWTGSMDFLSGSKGDGSVENPYQIATKADLMGLSELAAMGMTVSLGGGSYPGDYSGSCFRLTKSIDLGGMSWMPIGYYQNEADMTREVVNTFDGTFDGNGKTISNFKFYHPDWRNAGFFGSLNGAVIKNLTLEPSGSITGEDCIGILAGTIQGSTIYNVAVSGDVKANGAAGGIAGSIRDSVVENCKADITVDSNKKHGNEEIYVGGIAGKAAASTIVDSQVMSGTNFTARIQGKGYVGGIVGYQNNTDIYNVEVSGTIGGTGSTAIGGICGLYHAGKIKVARFTGNIGNSGLGSAAHEGTFIGTRNTGDHFVYGSDVSYLFADSESKITAGVCGSDVSDDNDYTYESHIGFYGNNLYFTLVQGSKTKPVNDRYFYEELEQGILAVMDDDLNGSGEGYTIDHFAPNKSGNPTRGYLVSVPQIDTVANGTYYTDVAGLEVKGSSSYNRVIDKAMRGAIAAGDKVTIITAPNNTEDEKYQLKGAGNNPDLTHNYVTYMDSQGNKKATAYVNGGAYTFTMPEYDTEVTAEYEKVATKVTVNPHEFAYKVIQTRTGNRKTPSLTTVVTDKDGKLIATYINGKLQEAQVQPVSISATVDNNNQVVDKNVKWTIDDSDLILLARNSDEDALGYTSKSASVQVNLNGRFFTDLIAMLEKKQDDSGYRDKIPDTMFGTGHQSGGIAVLTASTRPDASFEQKVSTDNCRIGVTFQVQDQTYVAGEGAVLDKSTLSYEVVRTLTGDRKAPVESITVTAPQSITATFSPDYFSKKDVKWISGDTGIAQVVFDPGKESQDKSYRYALVSGMKDSKWIRDIIAADQGIHENDAYAKLSGSGSRDVTISVTASDQLGGSQNASCIVTVNFRTDDKTRIIPEEVTLSNKKLTYDLSYTKKGNIHSETAKKDGFETQTLEAAVLPKLADDELHKPLNQAVTWKSSDPAVTVDDSGNVMPVMDAQWIMQAMQTAPYAAAKTVTITATTVDGDKSASCQVNLTFQVNCIELDREREEFKVVLTATGRRTSPTYTWSGMDSKQVTAVWYPALLKPIVKSSDGTVLSINTNGVISPVLDAAWMKEAMVRYPYSAEKTVTISAESHDGTIIDRFPAVVKFQYVDNTTSSSGGGGSSGGGSSGGGGGNSSGVTPNGSTNKTAPLGSVAGTWVNTADGRWTFSTNGRTYAKEWAFIHNPYAAAGFDTDWFRFDDTGHLVTGWLTDTDGNTYYLHPASDGRLGYMYRGWTVIDSKWHYFSTETKDGRTNGALLRNGITPDGYQVGEDGVWVR